MPGAFKKPTFVEKSVFACRTSTGFCRWHLVFSRAV